MMDETRFPAAPPAGLRRMWASRILLCVNVAVLVVLLGLFIGRGAAFAAPWDGPAVATVALAAATVVLAAVAIAVGLLAVWGYTTLREHAGSVAAAAAGAAADEAMQKLVKQWGISPDDPSANDEIARAYEKE
ncbi:MAG TPA: hypothetical protein VMU82_18190 [Acetobacteraceae bacterium]|nr:hypothetical protein [Acetobacteraceae bacterium]